MTNSNRNELSPDPAASDRREVLRNALAAAAAIGVFAPRVQAFTPTTAVGYGLPIDDIEDTSPLVGVGYCAHTVNSAGVGCAFPFTVGTEVCVDCPGGGSCAPHNGGVARTYRLRAICGGGVTCTGSWTPANGGVPGCAVACTSGNDGYAYC